MNCIITKWIISDFSIKFNIWNKSIFFQNNISSRALRHVNYFSSSNVDSNFDLSQSAEAINNQVADSIESLAKVVAQKDEPIEMPNPYERERKVCILCKYGIELDYKNPKLLSQFVSPFTGQLYDKHITRLCSAQHKKLQVEIKKSITAGLMPSMIKFVEFLKDPLICDPSNPIKPHKW